MPLSVGDKVGPYEITAAIGAGGMGQVFRALDIRLNRAVAVKISSEQFSARFEREARAIAQLNHPHICSLYDVGPNYLVMELVEGETLSARLKKGALPMNQVVRYGAEIADALAAAHAKGITHRDLKPENIMITKAGVKMLDFGLAKTEDDDETLTIADAVMGTPAYMAPEQREGKPADARSDIYALGLVLREMATGKRSQEISGPPTSFTNIVAGCLAADPADRWQSAADIKKQLEWSASAAPQAVVIYPSRIPWIIAAAASLAFVAGGSFAWLHTFRTPVADAPEMRLEISTPPTSDALSLSISNSGQAIVFVASHEGMRSLWLRRMDSTSAVPLANTRGASFPFWSPDGRFVGFFAERQLKKIEIASGSVQSIARAIAGRGGTWNGLGTIVYQPVATVDQPLYRIPATGGEPVEMTQRGRFPQFLPGGEHFLYFDSTPGVRAVSVGRLAGAMQHRLFASEAAAVYAASGHLIFVREGTMFSQRFDLSRMSVTGEPSPLTQGMFVNGPMFSAPISTSGTGPIAYRAGTAGGNHQFVWFDRSGKVMSRIGEPIENLLSPTISPDGRRVAMHRGGRSPGIWILDLERGVLSLLNSGGFHPVWSPDGNLIAFADTRNGSADIFVQLLSGARPRQLTSLTSGSNMKSRWPTDWSADGRLILSTVESPKGRDIWAFSIKPNEKPFPIVQTSFNEENGQFSGDGKWIAYESDESGRLEVYAQAFPGPGARVQLSKNGGALPRWRRDGKELFYIDFEGELMAVPVRLTGQSIESGSPAAQFATQVGGPFQTNSRQPYVASADGQRFLMNTIIEESGSPITILLNWKPK